MEDQVKIIIAQTRFFDFKNLAVVSPGHLLLLAAGCYGSPSNCRVYVALEATEITSTSFVRGPSNLLYWCWARRDVSYFCLDESQRGSLFPKARLVYHGFHRVLSHCWWGGFLLSLWWSCVGLSLVPACRCLLCQQALPLNHLQASGDGRSAKVRGEVIVLYSDQAEEARDHVRVTCVLITSCWSTLLVTRRSRIRLRSL